MHIFKVTMKEFEVDKSFREFGVGQALIETCFAFCEQEKAKYLSLQTAPDNKKAKRLYEKMGMKIDSEFDRYIKIWGNE